MNIIAPTDTDYMMLALKEAASAYTKGEVPVGAIIVYKNRVIARAYNQVELLQDATAHAEILAITQAAHHLRDWRLQGATLFVTKEPCSMCAGAMVNSRIDKVVFGVSDPKYGAAGSALNIVQFPDHLHQVEVQSGILEQECRDLLQDFFRTRRKQNHVGNDEFNAEQKKT